MIFFIFLIITTSTPSYIFNNITINEYDMIWSYTESISGIDSIAYRASIDKNNDSFVSAWEVMKADKEIRKKLRSSLEQELDVKINNNTAGIEVVDIDASLSIKTIGKTHLNDTIVNRYKVTYRFNESILNASSIWFLGEGGTPITITLPQGVEVINITGMNNITTNHTIRGFFAEKSDNKGEITLILKNTFYTKNVTPLPLTPKKTRDIGIVFVLAMILLIYLRKR